jgi:hypothetical protein
MSAGSDGVTGPVGDANVSQVVARRRMSLTLVSAVGSA